MEKKIVTVEKAKSGRSKCRRCLSKIEKGETRVGLQGWISGRQTTMWQKTSCFAKGMEVSHISLTHTFSSLILKLHAQFSKAKSSRGKCKMTGEKFEKGEDQLVFSVHNSRVPIKLSAVGRALEEFQTISTIKLEDVEGFKGLDESSVNVLKDSISGKRSMEKNKKKRPIEEEEEEEKKKKKQDEMRTQPKKKKKTSKKNKPEPVTVRDVLKRAEIVPKSFKIVSWNVDGLRAPFRLDGLKKIADEESPDLIVIQETKLQRIHTDEICKKCPDEYDSWWFCSTAKKGYSGTAVFTKKGASSDATKIVGTGDGTFCPAKKSKISSYFGKSSSSSSSLLSSFSKDDRVLSIRFGTGESQADAEGRSITIEYESFFVVNLYVPNSGQKLQRLEYRTDVWDTHLRSYVSELEAKTKKPVIVTGGTYCISFIYLSIYTHTHTHTDLNVAHKDIDVYNYYATHLKKQPGCTEAERVSFTQWLDGFDRVDALRALHGEVKGQYTYWSTRAKNRVPNRGLRLDYFVVPSKMIKDEHVYDCYILDQGFGGGNTAESRTPSDHCPIVCVLKK